LEITISIKVTPPNFEEPVVERTLGPISKGFEVLEEPQQEPL